MPYCGHPRPFVIPVCKVRLALETAAQTQFGLGRCSSPSYPPAPRLLVENSPRSTHLHGMDAVKLRSRTLIRTLARWMALFCRCLFLTVRTRVIAAEPGFSPHCEPDAEHRSLFCVWHDAILVAIFCGKTVNVAALVSQNYDGTVIADVLDAVGIQPVRGSSSRGGAAAIRQMFALAERKHLVIATDGPRGPRRVVKDGIVYLASQSGRPIVLTAIACSWDWRPRGRWTDMVIPLPFSRVVVLGGAPIRIPEGLSPQQLAPFRELVQRAMDELQSQADRLARGDEVEPAVPLADNPQPAQAA